MLGDFAQEKRNPFFTLKNRVFQTPNTRILFQRG